MKYFRNKGIKRLFLITIALIVSGAVLTYLASGNAAAAFICAFTCVLAGAVFFYHTLIRYKKIAELGAYLRRVNSGEYTLALNDYDEGELSVLQSEIYKVTVSLKEQNEQLNREKLRLSDALSDISHQFKTPLTSISIMCDLLANGGLDGQKRANFARQAAAQIERLSWLTASLLKLSKLDAGVVEFNPRSVPLSELIERSCAPLLITLELRRQNIIAEAEKGSVWCDLNWTAEALTNVLKNCSEHTPEGGRLCVKACSNTLFSEIKITDSGEGIEKSELGYIFDRFYRGKNSPKDSVGIGLALARDIAEAQGGSLTARNHPGGGAEFILRLPVK